MKQYIYEPMELELFTFMNEDVITDSECEMIECSTEVCDGDGGGDGV